jgi:hypothetical protein
MPRFAKIVLGILGFLLLFPIVFRPAVRFYITAKMHRFSRDYSRPVRTIDLPNGGAVQISGSEVMNSAPDQQPRFLWKAEYRPGKQTPLEYAGSWQAAKDVTQLYAAGALVVILPSEEKFFVTGTDQILVRTARGKWKAIQLNFRDIEDGIDPPELTSYLTSISVEDLRKIKGELGPGEHEMGPSCFVMDFNPKSSELRVVYSTRVGGGRIRLKFSEDGEALQLESIEELPGKGGR